VSDRNATARLTWSTRTGIGFQCDGCRARVELDARYLSVCVDVASFEFYGALCAECGERLEDELPREGGWSRAEVRENTRRQTQGESE
jgi:predicted amidophosphoribosyltransferase